MVVGASASAVMFQCTNIAVEYAYRKTINSVSAYIVALLIMSISFSSEIINLLKLFDNSCPDAFGVWSPRVQWCEWQVTVPIMLYLCLTLDVKKFKLSSEDMLILFLAWFSIFSAYVVSWRLPREVSFVMITFAWVSMTIIIPLNVYRAFQSYVTSTATPAQTPEDLIDVAVSNKRLTCALYLAGFFPFFPLEMAAGPCIFLATAISVSLCCEFDSGSRPGPGDLSSSPRDTSNQCQWNFNEKLYLHYLRRVASHTGDHCSS